MFVSVVALLYRTREFRCFDWTETNRRPTTVWSGAYFDIFSKNLGFFRFVLVCFGLFWNSLFQLFHFYTKTESFDVSIETKQTEDQLKQFDREHILVFFRKSRVVLVCFETVLFVSVVSKPKQSEIFGFMKQTETQLKQILFWIVSIWTELFCFCFATPNWYMICVAHPSTVWTESYLT